MVQLYAELSAGFEGMIADNKLRQQDDGAAEAPSYAEEAADRDAAPAPEPDPPAHADASDPLTVSVPAPAAMVQ